MDLWKTTTPGYLWDRHREQFPERQPIWGWWEDSPEVMEQAIDQAAEGGLDSFVFSWFYPHARDAKPKTDTRHVQLYLNAPNRKKMRFCLMLANSRYRIYWDDWDRVTQILLGYFADSQYVTLGGKPLVIIHRTKNLENDLGGAEALRECFARLQKAAQDKGLPGVAIVACVDGVRGKEADLHRALAIMQRHGYSYVTGFNYRGGSGQPKEIHRYMELVNEHPEIWARLARCSPMPYIPLLTSGWDRRPWEAPARPERYTWYYPDRTPGQFGELVRLAREWIEQNPDETSRERLMLVYAWNEYAEGGIIAPTVGNQGHYLKALRSAISPQGASEP